MKERVQTVHGDILDEAERRTAYAMTPPAQRAELLAVEIRVASLNYGPESLCGTESERREWVAKMRTADDESWKSALRSANAVLAIMGLA
jgi:hypothetical protein